MGKEYAPRPTHSHKPAPTSPPIRQAATRPPLQSLIGNQAMGRLLRAAMRPTQGKVTEPEQAAPESVHTALQSPGSSLDSNTRALFESRFAFDFSGVRVHADRQAARSAADVGAAAYTVGEDIVFGNGHFNPQSELGRGLLAHELTHVVQQHGAPPHAPVVLGDRNGVAEHEASRVAEQFAGHDHAALPPISPGRTMSLQMQKASSSSRATEERSAWNLIAVGWRTKDFLDVALVEHIEHVKQEFEDFDEEKLKSLAQGAVLQVLGRFVPGVGVALLIKDLAELGVGAAQTVDEALLADREEERTQVAQVLAGVFVGWAINVAIEKLGGAIRRKLGPRAGIREDIPAKPSVHPEKATHQSRADGSPEHSSPLSSTNPPASLSPHEPLLLLEKRRDHLLRRASDERVRSAIRELYRETATVGSGSTGDVLRHEIQTGQLKSAKGHWIKAQERRGNRESGLAALLRDPTLNAEDKAVVRAMLVDLQEGMSAEGLNRYLLKAPSTGKPPIILPPP